MHISHVAATAAVIQRGHQVGGAAGLGGLAAQRTWLATMTHLCAAAASTNVFCFIHFGSKRHASVLTLGYAQQIVRASAQCSRARVLGVVVEFVDELLGPR